MLPLLVQVFADAGYPEGVLSTLPGLGFEPEHSALVAAMIDSDEDPVMRAAGIVRRTRGCAVKRQ